MVPWKKLFLVLVAWSIAAFFLFVPIPYIALSDAAVVLLGIVKEVATARRENQGGGADEHPR
jgi:hypothetical protein